MHPSRHTTAATSGLLALAAIVTLIIAAAMLAVPVLDALARTLQALTVVLH